MKLPLISKAFGHAYYFVIIYIRILYIYYFIFQLIAVPFVCCHLVLMHTCYLCAVQVQINVQRNECAQS